MDVSGQPGATATYLVGYADSLPAGTILSLGEVLVDASSKRLFSRTQPAAGGVSVHSYTIPNDPSLQGAVAYSHVLILGGNVTATNAIKVRLR